MELIGNWIQNLASATGLKAWALTVFLVILAALLLDFIQRRLMKRLGDFVAGTANPWDDALYHAAKNPLSLLIWVIGVSLAVQLIPAGDGATLLSGSLMATLRQIGVLFALTWFLVSFVGQVENNIIESALDGGREIDRTTVNALARIVRITIVVTAILVALDTMGFSIAGLMAAGGIGGLAVGLAARDLLANFFGGVTVFIDRPFSVGDWILLKDKGVEGVVEKIGWRQTTIRKFDKRPVYVPNAIFTTASVENPSRMTHRRIYETVGMRYDDIGRMTAVTDEVRAMLAAHPEIDERQTLMVQFDAFGASSVDFFIYCMTHTVNWQHYHQIKQDVLLKISDIIGRHGAAIAFPTSVLYVQGPPEFAGLEAAGEAPSDRTKE